MTDTDFVMTLTRMDLDRSEEFDTFARKSASQARNQSRLAVKMLMSSDPRAAENAAHFLDKMDELAIVPLLETPDLPTVFQRVWMMSAVVDIHTELRSKIESRLEKLLLDKSSIPWQSDPGIEETPIPTRVCDEAYLMMRRMLFTNEEQTKYHLNSKAFRLLTNEEKDSEIAKAKNFRVWRNLLAE